jgi:hypothetical protein
MDGLTGELGVSSQRYGRDDLLTTGEPESPSPAFTRGLSSALLTPDGAIRHPFGGR